MLKLVPNDDSPPVDIQALSDEDRKTINQIAAAVDPEVWNADLPVPTRADTVSFHRRRIDSLLAAARVMNAIGDRISR